MLAALRTCPLLPVWEPVQAVEKVLEIGRFWTHFKLDKFLPAVHIIAVCVCVCFFFFCGSLTSTCRSWETSQAHHAIVQYLVWSKSKAGLLFLRKNSAEFRDSINHDQVYPRHICTFASFLFILCTIKQLFSQPQGPSSLSICFTTVGIFTPPPLMHESTVIQVGHAFYLYS